MFKKLRPIFIILLEYFGFYFGWVDPHQGVRNMLSFAIAMLFIWRICLMFGYLSLLGEEDDDFAQAKRNVATIRYPSIAFTKLPIVIGLIYYGSFILGTTHLIGMLAVYISCQVKNRIAAEAST